MAAGGGAWLASRLLHRNRAGPFIATSLAGVALLAAAFVVQAYGARAADPAAHAFAATTWTLLSWQGLHVWLVAVMVAYTLARLATG